MPYLSRKATIPWPTRSKMHAWRARSSTKAFDLLVPDRGVDGLLDLVGTGRERLHESLGRGDVTARLVFSDPQAGFAEAAGLRGPRRLTSCELE
jgi:hypothetical protein